MDWAPAGCLSREISHKLVALALEFTGYLVHSRAGLLLCHLISSLRSILLPTKQKTIRVTTPSDHNWC